MTTEAVIVQDEGEKLASAVAAFRRGNAAEARRLINSVLSDNPHSVTAWSWACEVAATPEERIYCLRQILAVDPSNTAARRYLAQLQPAAPVTLAPIVPAPSQPVTDDALPVKKRMRRSIADLVLVPLGCLVQMPVTYVGGILLALVLIGGYIYYTANTDFFGLADPKMDSLAISPSFEQIEAQDNVWKIIFEKGDDSQFAGLVRHVSPIRVSNLRILTHDILVTSGDYANPAIVRTSVFEHHFTWRSSVKSPNGTINLLHVVPASEDIYRQLLDVKSPDTVVITGREIFKIEIYDRNGVYEGDWHDTGCNSLLVKSVTIDFAP